uniref:Calcium-activated chloride channel regulator 1 n=1 Tax=Sus scrofa TaxID=9823 RepID=A0A287B0H7_PIG
MGFFSSVLLLVLHLLQGSRTSLVQLNANGYEGVLIAIDPAVPEDETLITEIKDMVTTASTFLFEATEKRFFFKNVSILIPESWKNTQYKRPKHESYKHADVIVAPPTVPGRDEPYTKQFTACGEKAEYIHFTPDFVLGKKQNEFGPPGRALVHEWAHLRWGVFDEYNDDEPFYMAKSKKIEATRCSIDITGINRVYKCQENNCVTRTCRVDANTKLYEKDCQFFPDKHQTEKTSIMFMQGIDSVSMFCNEKNHNREAPSLQNKKCDSRSTWEVISNSEDFKGTVPIAAPPPPPVFSLLKISERIVCLVLDKSESMGNHNRLNRMNQAVKYFLLQTIENGSWVGVVDFDTTAHIKSKLIQIKSNNERRKLLESLPTEASGGISICSGIESAFQVIKEIYPQVDGSEIILVVAGEDKNIRNCMDRVKQSGAIIHSIALGPNADPAVTEMSAVTGGMHFYTTDQSESRGLTDALWTFGSGNTNSSQHSLQLESKGLMLSSNPWMNGTVTIDSTVGKDTFCLVTWDKQPPGISLWDPSGTPRGNFTVDEDSKMAYLSIPGTAKVGVWTYSLQAKANPETLTITVNSRAANSAVPPITVNAKMNKDTSSFPSPMIVYAEILQGYIPILGASVTAFIESDNGETEVLELLDNGAGEIEGNPPRPESDEDTQTDLESFTRIASGGAFVISNVSKLPLPDLYPPSQITDLEATSDEDEIKITWTAPGDDFDVGTVEQYIIRISGSLLDLRDNFDDALQINTSALLPSEANTKESFAFKPGNLSEENATHIFIAIQSVDKSNLTSKVSNIAQVALFTPEADPSPGKSHPNPRINISALVLLVVGSVAVVSAILSATICILKKKRNAIRSKTGF